MSNTEHHWGRLESAAHDARLRRDILANPGAVHGHIAARELHWHDGRAWLRLETDAQWYTLGASGKNKSSHGAEWTPWHTAFDERDAPFYRWFSGAATNACFNEVDRHVLLGRGGETAIIFEGDRWDPSRFGGRGGPVSETSVSYRELLLETVLRAQVLRDLGLQKGDRIALNLPNILEQIYYTEAAKRLGIIYTPVFGGFSAKTLSDRIFDAGAQVVITADGGYRNAEIVSYKEAYTDQALDNFIPLTSALDALARVLSHAAIGDTGERLHAAVAEALHGEITLERSDLMREFGAALADTRDLSAELMAELRTAVARELALSLIHISEPTRRACRSRMPSSA